MNQYQDGVRALEQKTQKPRMYLRKQMPVSVSMEI